jgi:hypothetical protein
LPSQQVENQALSAVVVQGEDQEEHLEYLVESIVNKRVQNSQTQYQVKWTGYKALTWEPRANIIDTGAYRSWTACTKDVQLSTGRLARNWRKNLTYAASSNCTERLHTPPRAYSALLKCPSSSEAVIACLPEQAEAPEALLVDLEEVPVQGLAK